MTAILLLDIPENQSILDAARQDPAVSVRRVGSYFHVSSAEGIEIDRPTQDCRYAVWFSCLAGLDEARVDRFDKQALRVVAT